MPSGIQLQLGPIWAFTYGLGICGTGHAQVMVHRQISPTEGVWLNYDACVGLNNVGDAIQPGDELWVDVQLPGQETDPNSPPFHFIIDGIDFELFTGWNHFIWPGVAGSHSGATFGVLVGTGIVLGLVAIALRKGH